MKVVKLIVIAALLICSPYVFADTVAQTVAPAQAAMPTDADILVSVNQKIANDPTLAGYKIDATVSNQVVTLNGTVDTETQSNTLVNLIESIPGVAKVQSNVIIKAQPVVVVPATPQPPQP